MATIKPIEEEEELVFPATLDEALPMKVEPELMFPATLDEALPIESKTQPSLVPKKAPDRGGFKPLPEEEPVDLMGLGSEYQTVGSFDSTATAERSYTTIPEVATNKEKVADIRKFMSVRYPNMVIPKDDKEAVKSFVGTLSKSDFDLAND